MKTFFTSDPHFGHARINELAERPFGSVDEMNRVIVERFNETVGPEDRLIIMGDICMGKLDESLPVLDEIQAGEIVLVPGNHDRWSLAYQHRGDEDAKRYAFRTKYEAAAPGRILTVTDRDPSRWSIWDLTGDSALSESSLGGVEFSHYPYDGDSHGEDRHASLRAVDGGKPIIHGHVHQEWKINGRQYNVGVDAHDFYPVAEETLIDWVDSLI